MAREIRGWQIGEVVTANYMTLNSANMYEQTGSNGEANLPCIYNGLTLQSQSGTGNSIVTFNPGVARCQDLPTSTYTYLPSNAYGTSYPCFIDISLLDSNTVITLTTSPTSGYIVATFNISPTTAAAVDYVITGSLLQIATGSYNPAIHVRLCAYNYTGSTFNLDFTPGTSRDTDQTGLGGVQWNYQNSSLVLNTPASQTGSSIVVKQPLTSSGTTTLQSTTVLQGANALQFYNSGNTHYTSLQAGTVTSNIGFILPIADAVSTNQFITSNLAGQLSFATPASTSTAANIAANDSNVTFTSSSNPYQVCTPTAPRTYTMPAILTAGVPWTFYNQATITANYITLQTSGSNAICIVPPNGYATIVPLTSTPTTAANWILQDRQSNWANYTPSTTAFGTTSSTFAQARLIGRTLSVKFYLVMGTLTATTPSIGLPGYAIIDVNNLNLDATSGVGTSCVQGEFCVQGAANACGPMLPEYATSSTLMYFGAGYSTTDPLTNVTNANAVFNGNNAISGEFEVPITL